MAGAAVQSCSRSKLKQLLGTARVSKVRGNPFSHTFCHCERRKACGNPFSLRGITDSFALRAQNDTPFSYCKSRKACGYTFVYLSLRSRVNGCGNPFFFLRGIRILSRSVLRMTHRLVIANTVRCAEVRYILLLLKKQAKACFFAFKALFIHSILYRM